MGSQSLLSSQDREQLIQSLDRYLQGELDIELGQFDIEFLVDHISQSFGPIFYNQGLYDAQTVVSQQTESLTDAISLLEKSDRINR